MDEDHHASCMRRHPANKRHSTDTQELLTITQLAYRTEDNSMIYGHGGYHNLSVDDQRKRHDCQKYGQKSKNETPEGIGYLNDAEATHG
ncbi:hypothetical protein [Paraburkholderia sediminicola]|uniref:hypothetical protein n=1 Tax=Paraburkholderia sediminicola TaxID=458836 RepID=UPI0038BA82A5